MGHLPQLIVLLFQYEGNLDLALAFIELRKQWSRHSPPRLGSR
jgi:hypothetical protein